MPRTKLPGLPLWCFGIPSRPAIPYAHDLKSLPTPQKSVNRWAPLIISVRSGVLLVWLRSGPPVQSISPSHNHPFKSRWLDRPPKYVEAVSVCALSRQDPFHRSNFIFPRSLDRFSKHFGVNLVWFLSGLRFSLARQISYRYDHPFRRRCLIQLV